jgi:murein DD-endopeptidase MepM/ murein hydrolase activator NlpD
MLTNTRSNRNRKWRYLGVLPLIALMITLFHTSPELSVAGSSVNPESIRLLPVYESSKIPALFPLPEKYREKVTWGYNKEAIHPISKKLSVHQGVDISAPEGTPVYAAAPGKVKMEDELGGWGMLIILEHSEGFSTHYAHLDEFVVKEGDQVTKGQVIGRVGNTGQSTGPHLHYEVRKDGKHLNPADYY